MAKFYTRAANNKSRTNSCCFMKSTWFGRQIKLNRLNAEKWISFRFVLKNELIVLEMVEFSSLENVRESSICTLCKIVLWPYGCSNQNTLVLNSMFNCSVVFRVKNTENESKWQSNRIEINRINIYIISRFSYLYKSMV